MPAWITSLLRELVPVPIAPSASSTITSRPASASARAHASPTTPAPTTTQSTRSCGMAALSVRRRDRLPPRVVDSRRCGESTSTMPGVTDAPTELLRACPQCGQTMAHLALPGHGAQPVVVANACASCRLVWFDAMESVQLAGLGWLCSLRELQRGARGEPPAPRPPVLACPSCQAPLKTVHNATRFGRFAALECPQGHGHLHSHSGMLAERGLVRPLLGPERRALAEERRAIHCLDLLAGRWADGVQGVIDEFALPWVVKRLGCRAEYWPRPVPPHNGGEAAAAEDEELDRYLHLFMLNRGILMTPFHNMALMSPQTTAADVDRHTQLLREAARYADRALPASSASAAADASHPAPRARIRGHQAPELVAHVWSGSGTWDRRISRAFSSAFSSAPFLPAASQAS